MINCKGGPLSVQWQVNILTGDIEIPDSIVKNRSNLLLFEAGLKKLNDSGATLKLKPCRFRQEIEEIKKYLFGK